MTWLLLGFACTRAPIEDRWSHGPITQLKDSFTSNFAIETEVDGQTAWVIVDTGFNKNAAPLSEFLEEKSASLDNIENVVATHGHGDHIGSHDNFPNATFHVHESDVELLEEEGITKIEAFDGSTPLEIQGVTFIPLPMPGHTEGNVAYLVNDVLIMGDSGQSTKSGTIEPAGGNFTENPELAIQSLAGLKDQISPYVDQIEWVVFSHSGPLQGTEAIFEYTAP